MMNWLEHRARTIEFAVVAWLSLLFLAIHFIVATHAGPLWRDEISSLTLATMPTLQKFWSALVFDPCPAFFFLLLRFWHALGLGGSDFELLLLGFIIGLLILAALWWSCWRINRAAPIFPLAIFALHAVTFEFGDSLRAYGLAIVFIALAFAFIWQLTFQTLHARTIVFAALAAIFSVQTLTTNSLVLFAICIAALSVALLRKQWARFLSILLTGALAAVSLLIYLPIFRCTNDWSMLCVEPTSFQNILQRYEIALNEGGAITFWSWIVVALFGLAAALSVFFRTEPADVKQDRQCQILFGSIALVVATLAFLIFFRQIGWPTSAWYFLPLMAVSILSLRVFIGAFVKSRGASLGAIAVALFSICILSSTVDRAFVRRTNADLVANEVASRVTSEDFIIVSPYFYAVSFQRYYHGSAPWTALPSVDDYSLHRWDLLKRAMQTPDAIAEILSHAKSTLESGHTVYLIGNFPPAAAGPVAPLPSVPNQFFGWSFQAYVRNWGQLVSYGVHQSATGAVYFQMNENAPISPLEHLHVLALDRSASPLTTN
jgi:hypothetical protein